MKHISANTLTEALRGYRFRFTDEKELQDGVASVLSSSGMHYAREYRLTETDRPDFWIPAEGVAVEVKIKGSTSSVIRQLHRYAARPEVKAVVLVTSRMRHIVPDRMCGKQISTVVLFSL